MSNKSTQKKNVNDHILQEIMDALNKMAYGNLSIKVHNSKIVQIEITEKKRYDDIWQVEEGGVI